MPQVRAAGAASRRKLVWLGGLAALVGLARGARPVEAADGDPIILGQANSETNTTYVERKATDDSTFVATLNTPRPTPKNLTEYTAALVGLATDGGPQPRHMAAIYGLARGIDTFGLFVQSTDHSAIKAVGHRAAVIAYGRTSGVSALAYDPTGVAVRGSTRESATTGVLGESDRFYGVVGRGRYATSGYTTDGYAIYGDAPRNLGGLAAYLNGRVWVSGGFTVVNGPKSAAVPHTDGSHRRLYCQESPEPWFEDFGQATLTGGKAVVAMDKDFAAVVKTDNYHVFLSEYGASSGLYVASRTPTSFEVRSTDGGATSAFSYRIVARRRDIDGPRLEKVEVPAAIPFVAPPEVPDLAPPKTG